MAVISTGITSKIHMTMVNPVIAKATLPLKEKPFIGIKIKAIPTIREIAKPIPALRGLIGFFCLGVA